MGRRWLPAGVQTIVLALVALALLWGPLPVSAQEVPWLIANPPAPTGDASNWPFWLGLEARKAAGRLPTSLLFALPAVAVIRDRRRAVRPRWAWTEWTGIVVASLVAGPALVLGGWNLAINNFRVDVIAEGIGWCLQLLVTVLLDWGIIRLCDPAWNRLLGVEYHGTVTQSPPSEA